MTPPFRLPQGARHALAPLALALLAAAAGAQATAASENGIATVQGLPAAGGSSIAFPSAGTADASIGQLGTGPASTSASYRLEPFGVVFSPASFESDAPLVTGTRPSSGGAAGGGTVDVLGFNFDAPGAGLPAVDFDLAPATGVAVLTNTRLQVTPPAGADPVSGNPLPLSAVRVTNANGSFGRDAAYQYEPALVLGNPAQLERRLRLRAHTDPDDLVLFLFGQSLSGFGVPVPPFEGSLMILVNLQVLNSTLQPTPNGLETFEFDLPSNAPLVGATLRFQALALDDAALSAGSWSNLLAVTIFP